MRVACRKCRAFTLVELLVVIAIIGILMALLLPAVNAARDAMRRTQCKNNLAQIGRGCQAHVAQYQQFPTGGWGWHWQGDPDLGFDARQPGGWTFNILPFIGLSTIHDAGKGSGASKSAGMQAARTACIPLFICPARRKAIAYPSTEDQFANAPHSDVVGKSDYAANAGYRPTNAALPYYPFDQGGPDANCPKVWPKCNWQNPDLSQFNGICGDRSQVTPGQITDGLSNVILVGEKAMNHLDYYSSQDSADNDSVLEGYDDDINRWFSLPLLPDAANTLSPGPEKFQFGSVHSQGTHFVFCDGSVRMISYQVDFATYQSLGGRNDGTVSENY